MNVFNLFWANFYLAFVTSSGIKKHNLIRLSCVDLGLLVVNEHIWQLRRLFKWRRKVMKLLTQLGCVRVNTEMLSNAKGLSNWRLWLPKWNSSTSAVLARFVLTRNGEVNYVTIWERQNNYLLHDVHYQWSCGSSCRKLCMMIAYKWRWFYHITFPFISLPRLELNSLQNSCTPWVCTTVLR